MILACVTCRLYNDYLHAFILYNAKLESTAICSKSFGLVGVVGFVVDGGGGHSTRLTMKNLRTQKIIFYIAGKRRV